MVCGLETPPLTRGRPTLAVDHLPKVGNTPAYAGKTIAQASRASAVKETPPLTRGRRADQVGADSSTGNTPAYAGKTQRAPTPQARHGKHPRLRGEDDEANLQSLCHEETPPLTRGRPERGGFRQAPPRNTPAYAGKTFHEEVENLPLGKHPRLRGEDAFRTSLPYSVVETPPLTRGRPILRNGSAMRMGNTPAYAGKTHSFSFVSLIFEKHPRLRGEDSCSHSPVGK